MDTTRGNLGILLSDHAHCELKAAQSALSLVARFGGEFPQLVAPLSALAREETEHFEQVHQVAAEYGTAIGYPEADTYVNAVRTALQGLGNAPNMLDRLLVAAVIEARSCERFKVLSTHMEPEKLRVFYRELMESEARHFALFSQLADDCFGADLARPRLKRLMALEADIIQARSVNPTVHG